ncbi:O-antigen ligase family protein [Bacillus sp. B15-48]|uniref:O-antigen ligase family protein n=1 Tax=Bacillus sp. B15-48 TaxID=1548601 RepID=UPI00193F92A3|nr:O-antigen ligase family protein [Bacillus sp. B15-48]MBM4760885.1 hypothetical protein [Bacillus sp. B15-48]
MSIIYLLEIFCIIWRILRRKKMQNILGNKPVLQVFVAILVSIVLGWGVGREFTFTKSQTILFLWIGILFAVGFIIILIRFFLKRYSISRLIIFGFIISAFLGSGILSVEIGPISLFPYRVFLPIAILLFLIKWWQSRQFALFESEPLKPILFFLIFWILYSLLSLTWAPSLFEGIKNVIFLGSGIFFTIFFVYLFNKQDDYLNLINIWLLVLFLFVLIGYWNYFTLQHLPLARMHDAPAYVRHRPTAVFTNENDYASYLALSFFIALGVLQRSKNILYKLFAGMLVISAAFQIFVSSSRANLLALAIGGTVWFLFFTNQKEKKFILLLGVFGFILANLFIPDSMMSIYRQIAFQVTSLFDTTDVGDTSTDIRINLLKNALMFIASSFGLGIGAGNIEFYMQNHPIFPTVGTLNVHNWWAEVFVNYGIFVFVGYLLMYFWLMIKLYWIYKASISWKYKLISQSLCTSLVAFSIASISPSSIMTLNYVWILFGVAIAFVNYWMKKYHLKEKVDERHSN